MEIAQITLNCSIQTIIFLVGFVAGVVIGINLRR